MTQHLLSRFGSWHPHGGSQSSITPVSRDLTLSSKLYRPRAQTSCTYIHAGKGLIHIKWDKYKFVVDGHGSTHL